MCGFTGWFDHEPQTRNILEEMTSAIAHRGPDASGFFYSNPVALGHRRLSIIDLAGSHQPMMSSDERYILVYNGELYNFPELRAEMEKKGIRFQTEGDTEVLLQALILWKEEALHRLQGMFAFAFWDRKDQELLLARDHLGVKPLYFCWDSQRLLFASEIKALLPHPKVSREIDPQAIALYLECQYIPAPLSIYRQIRKLPPAHYLRLKKGTLEEKPYWTPTYLPKWPFDEKSAVEELEKHLRRSVSSMLIADVPVGTFVSGGIDSSLIAALVREEMGKKIPIFHIGFEKGMPSEHEHAQKVATHLDAEHHPLFVTIQQVLDTLEHWVETFDEPFGDQAALPTLLLSQLTKGHVKVVLTGEGADEVFGGYSNYTKRLKEARFSHYLGSPLSPLRWLYPLFPQQLRKNRFFKTLGRSSSKRYTTIPNLFDSETHASIFSQDFHRLSLLSLEDLAANQYFHCDSDQKLDQMLHVDQKLWLADDLLTKVDRATMAHSIEARVPYLDHKLVEFAARLPPSFKIKEGSTKYLLKKVAEKILPPEIVHRPKSGFVLPLKEWIATGFKGHLEDTLSSQGLLGRNLFNPGVIERLRKEEASGRRRHGTRLWALHALELWFRRYSPNYKV